MPPVGRDEETGHAHAMALYGQGRIGEALTAAFDVLTAHPNSARAQYTYASLLREAGRDRDALAVINRTLQFSPSADALVLRGDLQRSLAGARAAEADYLHALRLHPDHPLALHNLAVSWLRMGSVTKAVRGLLAAVRLDPSLGPLAVGNIGLAITRVLRWATASVVFLASALIAVTLLRDDGQSTLVARLAVAVLTVPLIVAIIWTVHTVPGPVLRVVVRAHWLLGGRLVFLTVAVIVGTVAAVTGTAGVLGPLLLLGMVVVTVLGWVTGA